MRDPRDMSDGELGWQAVANSAALVVVLLAVLAALPIFLVATYVNPLAAAVGMEGAAEAMRKRSRRLEAINAELKRRRRGSGR